MDDFGLPIPGGPILADVNAGLDLIYVAVEALFFTFPGIGIILGLILDIILALLPLFEGKPREQDTMTIARRLMNSRNMAMALWGNQIYRLLNDQNIVLSSSDPHEQELLAHSFTQAWWNVTNQGIPQAHAIALCNQILSDTTGPDQPLPHPLNLPAPQGVTMWGPQKVLDDYNFELRKQLDLGKTPDVASRLALRWLFTHQRLEYLWWIQFLDHQPDKLIPFRKPPKLPGPQPKGPHEPIFPPVLHPQPQGCTDPCQLELIAQIELVVAQLQAATTPLTAIIENLPLFIQALQNLSNPAVANALQSLVDCICPALDTIARELSNPARASDHDYTEELKSIAAVLDGSDPKVMEAGRALDSMIDLAVQKYLIPSDLAQIVTSS